MPKGAPAAFTKDGLRSILMTKVLRNASKLKVPSPTALELLARHLNGISQLYAFTQEHPASEAQRRMRDVGVALGVLGRFFRERRPFAKGSKSEQRLRNRYGAFLREFRQHELSLALDTMYMADVSGWRDLAPRVAGYFAIAMKPQTLGVSNDGPIPRFVAEVVSQITGETPTVTNVAKHLKDAARGIKRKSRGQRTGARKVIRTVNRGHSAD